MISNDNDGVVATYTLNLNGAGTGEIQTSLVEPAPDRKLNLAKNGNGTWTITANQTYTGSTTVSAGKLPLSLEVTPVAALIPSHRVLRSLVVVRLVPRSLIW